MGLANLGALGELGETRPPSRWASRWSGFKSLPYMPQKLTFPPEIARPLAGLYAGAFDSSFIDAPQKVTFPATFCR